MILDELRELVGEKASKDFKISRVCVGLFHTGVMLENRYVGLCHTPTEDIPHVPGRRGRNFHGLRVSGSLRLLNSFNMVERAVGIAALNAVSQHVMDREGYEREIGVDVFDAIEAEKEDKVAVVGYMRPLVGKLRGKVKRVLVFERSPRLRGDALPDTFVEQLLPKADVVVISGASLVNGTIDRLLELSRSAKFVAVAGPSASALPEPFFERGVKVMAGVLVKGQAVLNEVAEAKPFAAFKERVRKYVLRKK